MHCIACTIFKCMLFKIVILVSYAFVLIIWINSVMRVMTGVFDMRQRVWCDIFYGLWPRDDDQRTLCLCQFQ